MSLQDRDAIERGKRAMKWISADPHNRSEEATRDLLHGFRALLAQPEAQAEEGERKVCAVCGKSLPVQWGAFVTRKRDWLAEMVAIDYGVMIGG